jgi:hypothetical protein
MPNPVVHFEVGGRDAEKLQKFYADVFHWEVDANNEMKYGIVKASDGGIGGGIGPHPMAPVVTFYVAVDDLQAYLERVEKLGGKTITPPTEIPNMVTFAMFEDPEGNKIGLVKG